MNDDRSLRIRRAALGLVQLSAINRYLAGVLAGKSTASITNLRRAGANSWDNVVHTSRHQQLFCAKDCLDFWCRRTGFTLGCVMDLDTLWRFAAHLYDAHGLRLRPA